MATLAASNRAVRSWWQTERAGWPTVVLVSAVPSASATLTLDCPNWVTWRRGCWAAAVLAATWNPMEDRSLLSFSHYLNCYLIPIVSLLNEQVYGVCCASHDSGAVPVPIDPLSGLPAPPTFPWWVYFPTAAPTTPTLPPWAPKPPTPTTTTTTTTTTQAPSTTKAPSLTDLGGANTKYTCGIGPKKMLSFDDYASRIIGGKDAVKNSWPFIVRFLTPKPFHLHQIWCSTKRFLFID